MKYKIKTNNEGHIVIEYIFTESIIKPGGSKNQIWKKTLKL